MWVFLPVGLRPLGEQPGGAEGQDRASPTGQPGRGQVAQTRAVPAGKQVKAGALGVVLALLLQQAWTGALRPPGRQAGCDGRVTGAMSASRGLLPVLVHGCPLAGLLGGWYRAAAAVMTAAAGSWAGCGLAAM
jgi:hypothetical protein